MECLSFGTYVEGRMSAMGLSTPQTLFDSYDQGLARLAQVASIATLSPAASVGGILVAGGSAAGIMPLVGMMSAVGGMFYLSALAGSMFFAVAEGQYCKNTNSLNAAILANWMRSKGIYDVDGLDAEFLKNPRLGMA